MAIVRNILRSKGYQVWSVPPTVSVLEALELMAREQIGAVLVMENHRLLGIFSERDYAWRGVLQGRSEQSPVDGLMTPVVFAVSPDQTLDAVMKLMTDKHIRHLPVVENDQVIGVISIGDVVKSILAEQKDQIVGMENYILGREHAL